MAKKIARLKAWFDEEGDSPEVNFVKRKGSFRSIGADIYERVDTKGKVVGFAIFNFMKRDRKTVEIRLEEANLAAGRREENTRARKPGQVCVSPCLQVRARASLIYRKLFFVAQTRAVLDRERDLGSTEFGRK